MTSPFIVTSGLYPIDVETAKQLGQEPPSRHGGTRKTFHDLSNALARLGTTIDTETSRSSRIPNRTDLQEVENERAILDGLYMIKVDVSELLDDLKWTVESGLPRLDQKMKGSDSWTLAHTLEDARTIFPGSPIVHDGQTEENSTPQEATTDIDGARITPIQRADVREHLIPLFKILDAGKARGHLAFKARKELREAIQSAIEGLEEISKTIEQQRAGAIQLEGDLHTLHIYLAAQRNLKEATDERTALNNELTVRQVALREYCSSLSPSLQADLEAFVAYAAELRVGREEALEIALVAHGREGTDDTIFARGPMSQLLAEVRPAAELAKAVRLPVTEASNQADGKSIYQSYC